MNKIIITNNSKVFKKYYSFCEVIYMENGNYMDVLEMTRDLIHTGCKLLTHPMSGSLKPNQTPYKSIIVSGNKKTDYESVVLIENSIEASKKFLKFKQTPLWNEKIKDDFKTVDLSLIENVVKNPMFNVI
ncbi:MULTISPECIES: GrdX family protein [unclassified Sedimentibacter]|uniref:GrdX family protein n=1 Tax=unclassified Sedimentibacter TaxID=2649220 RepID=UPI0027DFF1D3|nr:GrdX family protein [Sedimentibacter sp. MB35-C1]WMJ77772.1 GrdX family protein [Sedimentibacter sp. MB35-C1]